MVSSFKARGRAEKDASTGARDESLYRDSADYRETWDATNRASTSSTSGWQAPVTDTGDSEFIGAVVLFFLKWMVPAGLAVLAFAWVADQFSPLTLADHMRRGAHLDQAVAPIGFDTNVHAWRIVKNGGAPDLPDVEHSKEFVRAVARYASGKDYAIGYRTAFIPSSAGEGIWLFDFDGRSYGYGLGSTDRKRWHSISDGVGRAIEFASLRSGWAYREDLLLNPRCRCAANHQRICHVLQEQLKHCIRIDRSGGSDLHVFFDRAHQPVSRRVPQVLSVIKTFNRPLKNLSLDAARRT